MPAESEPNEYASRLSARAKFTACFMISTAAAAWILMPLRGGEGHRHFYPPRRNLIDFPAAQCVG